MSNIIEITIGEYLFKRLEELGCRDVIGVPGDFNLPLLEEIKKVDGIRFVGACNELNAAYMADGYGRINGISALFTTYGVGELSAINGVAGAYSEHVPMVCIVGAPPQFIIRERKVIHHTLGDGNYDNMLEAHRSFTASQVRLTSDNAQFEIDRALKRCIQEKRPVYIQVPIDLAYHPLKIDYQPLNRFFAVNHAGYFEAAVEAIVTRLKRAERPAILIDRDVMRYHLEPLFEALIERYQIPYCSVIAGKCALSESHPLWLGFYSGGDSLPFIKEAIEESDCLITMSPLFDDLNSGGYTVNLPEETIYLHHNYIQMGKDIFGEINVHSVLESVIGRLEAKPKEINAIVPYQNKSYEVTPNKAIKQNYLWQRLRSFFKEDDVVVMDNGASSGALEAIRMPDRVTYMSQPLWASIGFALPAMLGSLLVNSDQRHILFIGDGAFQLTAQELSTIMRHDFKPIIFLINNRGYSIERFILGKEAAYNDVANWSYTELPKVLSRDSVTADTFIVTTEDELDNALKCAEESENLVFIELLLEPLDAAGDFEAVGHTVAEFTYGPYGPRP